MFPPTTTYSPGSFVGFFNSGAPDGLGLGAGELEGFSNGAELVFPGLLAELYSTSCGSSQHPILISTIQCDGAAKVQEHVPKTSYPDYSVLFALGQVTVEYM